jgi:hypothetical protein
MTSSRNRIGAVLLASAMAIATPLTAHAFGRGGGGGGHFGGGGGGAHFGGGGGGGMHFGGDGGGGGGGGMHFGGGGGGLRLGGGGMHFGGGHFGGLRIGGGGLRLGGMHIAGFHVGGRHLGGFPQHTFHTAGHGFHSGHGLVNQRLVSGPHAPHAMTARALTGRGLQHQTFAHQNFGHQNFAHNGFRHGHDFHRFRGLFGWAGPLFWPYAYDDIYDDVFWGYGYGDPFWDYGYGDIYGGMFSPFGFDDLAGYMPSQQGGGRVRRGRSYETTAALPSGQPTAGQPSAGTALSGGIAQMCGDDTREVASWPIDRIQQLIMPTDAQRMALDDLGNASVKAAQIIKNACPTVIAFTPTGRLGAMQQRIEAMKQAVDMVREPIERLYGLLTDEQKAQLNAASQTPQQQTARSRGSLTQNCATVNAATQWPGAQIEKTVRPNETQLARLNALQSAAAQAAEKLAASCPSELPATPPARLAAVAKRLDVMLEAVGNVRAALGDFYGSLNDEQKAQFNLIGQQRSAQRQG